MFMIPVLGWLFQGAVLWFIIVSVTQQHDLPWRRVVFGLLLTVLAGLIVPLMADAVISGGGHSGQHLNHGAKWIISVVMQIGVLYGLLRWNQIHNRHTWIIIACFVGFRLLWSVPRLMK